MKENKHVNNKNFGIRSKPEDNKKSRKPEDSRKPETKKRSCENKLEGNRKPLSKLKNQKM